MMIFLNTMLSGVIKVLRVMVYGSATHSGGGHDPPVCVKGCPFSGAGKGRKSSRAISPRLLYCRGLGVIFSLSGILPGHAGV